MKKKFWISVAVIALAIFLQRLRWHYNPQIAARLEGWDAHFWHQVAYFACCVAGVIYGFYDTLVVRWLELASAFKASTYAGLAALVAFSLVVDPTRGAGPYLNEVFDAWLWCSLAFGLTSAFTSGVLSLFSYRPNKTYRKPRLLIPR